MPAVSRTPRSKQSYLAELALGRRLRPPTEPGLSSMQLLVQGFAVKVDGLLDLSGGSEDGDRSSCPCITHVGMLARTGPSPADGAGSPAPCRGRIYRRQGGMS